MWPHCYARRCRGSMCVRRGSSLHLQEYGPQQQQGLWVGCKGFDIVSQTGRESQLSRVWLRASGCWASGRIAETVCERYDVAR